MKSSAVPSKALPSCAVALCWCCCAWGAGQAVPAGCASRLCPQADVLFALAGVGSATELGQPRASAGGRARQPPPPQPRAAPRQPGGAEPHAPHTPGRARAGPAAVPEAQGKVQQCCLMAAVLSRNPSRGPLDFSLFTSLLLPS